MPRAQPTTSNIKAIVWEGSMNRIGPPTLLAPAPRGMTMVNLPTAGVDYHAPFGGRKASNLGPREQGRYAAEFYTTVKTAYTMA